MNACGGNGLRATGIKEQLETESKHRNEERKCARWSGKEEVAGIHQIMKG